MAVRIVARGEESKKRLRDRGITPGEINSGVNRSRGSGIKITVHREEEDTDGQEQQLIIGVHDETTQQSRLATPLEKEAFKATSGGQSVPRPATDPAGTTTTTRPSKTEYFVVQPEYKDYPGGASRYVQYPRQEVVSGDRTAELRDRGNIREDSRLNVSRMGVLPVDYEAQTSYQGTITTPRNVTINNFVVPWNPGPLTVSPEKDSVAWYDVPGQLRTGSIRLGDYANRPGGNELARGFADIGSVGLGFAGGAVTGFTNVFFHPVETVKGTVKLVTQPQTVINELREGSAAYSYNPQYYWGNVAGQVYGAGKGIQVATKLNPVNIRSETVTRQADVNIVKTEASIIRATPHTTTIIPRNIKGLFTREYVHGYYNTRSGRVVVDVFSKEKSSTVVHESFHKAFSESSASNRLNRLTSEQITTDYFSMSNRRFGGSSRVYQQAKDVMTYEKHLRAEETLARFTEDFPSEVFSPTTKTGSAIRDIYLRSSYKSVVREPITPLRIIDTYNIRTLGLEFRTRALPLITSYGGQIRLGNYRPSFSVKPSQLPGSTPMPETALGGAVFRRIVEFTPEEQVRTTSAVQAGRALGNQKGLSVEEFTLKIDELRNPKAATKIVESTLKDEGGVIFGSLVTERLPQGYRNVKIGDVDVVFPRKTVAEITPVLERMTKRLRASGEDVRMSAENVIEFRKTGEKFFEAKSGIDQEILGLDDIAPSGFLGFRFGDLHRGELGKTVKFGEARSITAGEQLLRKGAGALITSPGTAPGETPSFSLPGLLGKQGNPRGLKDVAGFIQTGRGLAEIQAGSWNPFNRVRSFRAGRALDRFYESYTPEQRLDIQNKLNELTGGGVVELSVSGGFPRSSSFANFLRPSTGLVSPATPSSYGSPSVSVSYSSFSSPASSGGVSAGRSYSPSNTNSMASAASGSSSPSLSLSRSYYSSPSPSLSPSLSFSRSYYSSPSPSLSPSLSRSYGRSLSLSPVPTPTPERSGFFGGFRSRQKPLYEVYVKRFGQYKRASINPLTLRDAFRVGRMRVEQTPAASFRIVSMQTKSPISPRSMMIGRTLRGGKSDPFAFVERSTFRINTPGEVRGISFLGVRSQKKRKGGKYWVL